MANLPMEGCVTQVSIMREVKNLLGLYLSTKDLKSGKKWPGYGRFTNRKLGDSRVYHGGLKGLIRASSEPKN